jgi:hypothetical protein
MTLTLGGSRVADAIGLGWSSPIRLFGELTGKPGFPPAPDNGVMRLGRRLQPVIFAELNETGYPCHEFAPDYCIRDRERPWLIGHPDGCGFQSADGLVVEAKAQAYPHHDFSAQVQTLTYMHLGDYSGGLIGTLSGLHVEAVELPRDEEKIGRILALADRFWEYVQADSWPPPTWHPDDRDAIGDAHPTHTPGRKVRETRAVMEARRELRMLNEQDGKHGARTRRKTYLGGIVTAHMGDAELLISAHDEVVARWPSFESQRLDSKRLREDHPELADAYTSTSTTRRLSLS